MTETQEQRNSSHPSDDKPWLFRPGQSGNPGGRPKGSKSLKTFVQEYLRDLPDEEKIDFIKGLPKDVIWKMGEGNPATNTDITSGGDKIVVMPAELITKNAINSPSSPSTNS